MSNLSTEMDLDTALYHLQNAIGTEQTAVDALASVRAHVARMQGELGETSVAPAEAKHTPLPWSTHGNCPCGEIYAADGNVLIHRATSPDDGDYVPFPAQQAANAEFIVRACNSHYALLDACSSVLQSDMAAREEDEGRESEVLNIVRNAITQANRVTE